MRYSYEKKIRTLPELAKIVSTLKKQGKTVVQCHGVFDLIHPGHIRHFASAKKEADVLLVTITADGFVRRGPGRPFFSEHLRAEALAALAVVDYVSILPYPTAIEAIKLLKPDIYAKGPDYKQKRTDVTGKIAEEARAIRSVGGRLFITEDVTFSSSQLINRHLEIYPPKTVAYLKEFAGRYGMEQLLAALDKVRKLKILVIGDAIIDQYHYCTALGKSSKEHIVVNKYQSDETFAGGSLATANHTRELARSLELLTVLGGKNSFRYFIKSHISKGIRPYMFVRPDAPTTLKRRFVAVEQNRKLFEICYLDDRAIPAGVERKIGNFLKARLRQYDLVIVADFGHGLMTEKLIRLVCQKARCLALNVQTNSANIGFNLVTKYRRADFVCIDEQELRLATHDRHGALPELVKRIAQKLRCEQVMVTRGQDGSLSYRPKEGYHWSPAFSYRIVDKIGAGDAFFAFAAPCFAAGLSQEVASFVGNCAGSIAVGIVCNREPVRYADLVKFMGRLSRF